jgi:ankyrin repeat protein
VKNWYDKDDVNDVFTVLLQNGTDPNIQDNEGNTVLHTFVFDDDEDRIYLLLEKGSSLFVLEIMLIGALTSIPNNQGRTPLWYAKVSGHSKINFPFFVKTLRSIHKGENN